jgi:hypothetical protein
MSGAAHSAPPQSFSELASNDHPTRHQRLLEAARKEGSLTLYTSIPEKDMAVLSADFEKRYGVRVNVWRASTVKVLQRVVAEKERTAGTSTRSTFLRQSSRRCIRKKSYRKSIPGFTRN